MTLADAKALADRIADRLFTNGAGQVADRLVCVQEDVGGDLKRDLGGWCRGAVVDQVVQALTEDAGGVEAMVLSDLDEIARGLCRHEYGLPVGMDGVHERMVAVLREYKGRM